MPVIRIRKAMQNSAGMDQSEIDKFLSTTKTPLRLATTNSKGEPNIHPVWYYYANNKLYFMTNKDSLKIRNVIGNSTVYFSIDTDAMPSKGVKGKGIAAIVKDTGKAMPIYEKIVGKYLRDLQGSSAKTFLEAARKGTEVLVEITPHYYSTWDYTK